MSKIDMNELRERAEKLVQADAARHKSWHDEEGLHPECQCIRDLLAALDEQGKVIEKLRDSQETQLAPNHYKID